MLDEDAGTGEMPFSLAVIGVNRNDSDSAFLVPQLGLEYSPFPMSRLGLEDSQFPVSQLGLEVSQFPVRQLGFVDSPSPELFFEAKIAAAVFVNNEYPMVSVEAAGMVDVTIVPILDAVDTKFPALGLESVVSKPEFHGALPCAVPIQ